LTKEAGKAMLILQDLTFKVPFEVREKWNKSYKGSVKEV